MENSEPGCSKYTDQQVDISMVEEEINELKEIEDLNVWGQSQEVLENQALTELEIFAKQNSKREDGELSENENTNNDRINNNTTELDIATYIKRQDELKKIQEQKKLSIVSEKSSSAAQKLSDRQLKLRENRKRCAVKLLDKCDQIKKSKATNNKKESSKTVSDDEYIPSEADSEDSEHGLHIRKQERNRKSKSLPSLQKIVDDGSLDAYKCRLGEYYNRLEKERELLNLNDDDYEDDDDVEILPSIKLPKKLWNKLYDYQQDGVKWMFQLHKKLVGGLLGDEMGLGKTVQVIVFLFILNYNSLTLKQGRYVGLGPTLIVCPATVVHQWVKHFHEWVPEFRVAFLHQSGSYSGNKQNLIKDINKDKGILLTTYSGFLKYQGYLIEKNWHYLILDEGHKIRNHSSQISVAVKRINTPHRLLLTGSPMQNNLQELWSLFDFVNPGLLGTLQVFTEHFVNPIIQGGFVNASLIQEETALSVAIALKNILSSCMLRRTKAEVQKYIRLPNKKEQVLFCKLTDEQIDLYKGYLMSDHVNRIIGKGNKDWYSENQMKANMFIAITNLRKICNHPDIYLDAEENQSDSEELDTAEKFGYYKRSGKMVVVSALLKLWKKQNHRVLLFTQARSMILIFEEYLKQQDYKYLKMDGGTNVTTRQSLIDKFNQDSTYYVFLLTTRVGGLGINLTGANRVIIYDPDWNPATDTQARERAWRIGQEKDVTIYRLISAGTIEEKMYQRQIWKQLLSNKVLVDPKTQKFFRNSNLHDLFSLQELPDETNSETANIFKNSRIEMQKKIDEKRSKKKNKHKVVFSEDKIREMKNLAQQISKNLTQNNKPEQQKNSFELEMKLERIERKGEKEYLKTLTPMELLQYNRQKLQKTEDTSINEMDGYKTDITFSKALDISQKTAKLHVELQRKRDILNDLNEINKEKLGSFDSQKLNKGKSKVVVDTSGRIDGEVINGLVKTEIKKDKTKKSKSREHATETQDDYVLNKLFSKKGVQTALQHDNIVDNRNNFSTFRIQNEAQEKADLALEALRKSRLNKWRW